MSSKTTLSFISVKFVSEEARRACKSKSVCEQLLRAGVALILTDLKVILSKNLVLRFQFGYAKMSKTKLCKFHVKVLEVNFDVVSQRCTKAFKKVSSRVFDSF